MNGFYIFLVGAGIFLFGAYLLKRSINLVEEINRSGDWPVTKGKILKSELIEYKLVAGNKFGPSYRLDLVYEYVVGSKSFVGTKPFLYTMTKKTEAKNIVKKFPVGKVFDVYYDLNFPENAVLITGGRAEKKYHEIVVSVVVMLVGAGLCISNIGNFLEKFN